MSENKDEPCKSEENLDVAGSQSQHDKITKEITEDLENKKESVDNTLEVENKVPETTTTMPNIVPVSSGSRMTIPESTSDFKDWLEGIKMVARLPGGLPVEFRRKLWVALAERYLKRRGVDWEIEKVKWFSEKWRADDEELGIQIVKDLHRTGHSLLAGPSGALNQAKLKRILMGYTRWNPEVGYCQGFNMLGAIILQVMDKNEVDSIKIMIFLIEGLLPTGYFCGSLMGLQADIDVFRELLGNKLPKLARHLQKLQYPTNEPSVEPPLINVFTMQWFLTLFCNCLPMSSVLRIWDLIMIEGSDVLLRTALAIWKLLEERILREVRTADDFYCKMETLSAELLDETRIDSNVMVQIISELGPIRDLQKLRHKHLSASFQDQKKLKMIYSKVQGESERFAASNARGRRGSQPQQKEQSDREKIALDITILKKQYDKLRERQKQAHIILTSAVTKQHQQKHQNNQNPTNVNKLLMGKHAINSKGNRRGPPKGAIPPVRKVIKGPKTPINNAVSNNATSTTNNNAEDTLQWKNTDEVKRRKNSLTWKEINAESSRKRSDSSSYSENSDSESSTSTSLCDDENNIPSLDSTPIKKKRHKEIAIIDDSNNISAKCASSTSLTLTTPATATLSEIKSCPEIALECLNLNEVRESEEVSKIGSNLTHPKFHLDLSPDPEGISSISQLSPLPDISSYFTAISPIKTPCNFFAFPDFSSFSIGSHTASDEKFEVNEQGVTNEFFERVTSSNAFNILPSHISCNITYSIPQSTSSQLSNLSDSEDASHIPLRMSQSYPSKSSSDENSFAQDVKTLKHINQKSFSMEEGGSTTDDLIKINRSFSDGTIMEVDDFQKIIAENSKILIKLGKFGPDSMESLTKTIEPIIEETKTSSNSSECEEIAAIDVEEPTTTERGIFLSEIQDIADMEEKLKSRNSENISVLYAIAKPSTTMPLICNTNTNTSPTHDEHRVCHGDVTLLQNEKSMNEDKNSDTLATLQEACNSPHSTTTSIDSSSFGKKSLPLKDVSIISSGDEVIEKEIISPKFNEISALVDKLKKEVMESDKIINENEVKVNNCENLKKKEELRKDETISDSMTSKTVKVTITINNHDSHDDNKKENNVESKTSGDLEKSTIDSATTVEKIDKNSNSESVLAKLNTQLEKCQQQSPQSDTKNNVNAEMATVKSVKSINANQNVIEEKQATKDSSKILEKLNFQLQRYEGEPVKVVPSRSPSNERSSDYKKEIESNDYKKELEALIKEREIEKNQKYRSNFNDDIKLSPSKSNHTLYDHEPRNEIRRRDVVIQSLEVDQRTRRPFKSSPSSSLSSSPSNISSTLSSIQNTIKSLDSACQRSEIYNYKKLDKAMESIEKMCESDREWHYYKRIKSFESPPSFRIDDILNTPTKSLRTYEDTFVKNRYESELSPVKKAKTPELDADYIARLRCLSTEEYIAGRKSPLGLTTDRYSRMDRSPTSPVLSSTRFLKSPTGDRSSKSAENSPSRYSSELPTLGTRTRYIPSDLKAESLSNLSYKSSTLTDKSRPKYYDEFEWEKSSSACSSSSTKRKYDI